MRFHENVMGVYFDDLDAYQILHNARYLLLFERTIGSFWRHLGWGAVLDAEHAAEEELRHQMDSLQTEFQTVNDRYLRLAAEFQNYRRRAESQ